MKSAFRIMLVAVAVAALAFPIAAQQADNQTASNPLVQLLQSKGILSPEEASTVRTASTTAEANERLARLLWSKGLISQQEYNSTVAAAAVSAAEKGSSGAHMVNAATPAAASAAATPAAPSPSPAAAPAKSAVWPVSEMMVGYDPSDGASADAGTIPAIAPIRVLPIGIPKDPKGIIPDIKLGSGAMLNVYGFFKASSVYDSTSSGGQIFQNNDFPLPLLLGDTGPDAQSQFHIKARAARAGVNFFYPISGPDITLTGKLEFDWEGDYEVANNRNISSLRSNMASLRLAWVRMDAKLGTVPWFAEFGQDWTLLGSSTVYDIFETTGFGVAFGNFYERIPQFKTGLQFSAGKVKIEPEFAITLGAFGDANLNNALQTSLTGLVGQVASGQQEQARFGAILGSDSGQPGVQGRLVFDFPLNSGWKGVPNAEIIFSGAHSEAEEVLPVGNIPTTIIPGLTCPGGAATCNLRAFYPTGLTMSYPSNAFSAEIQLPTPWVTIVSKYYRGGDLRFMFAGQLQQAFADLQGGKAIAIPAASLVCAGGSAGCSSTVAGTNGTIALGQNVWADSGDPITFYKDAAGVAHVAPYRPIRAQGGVFQLGFPLSRIFRANPDGLNSGWRLFLGYGVDSTFARDTLRGATISAGLNGGAAKLLRSDYVPVSLRYRINKWAEIVNEVTWYDSRTVDKTLVLYRGVDAHVAHDWREEFGPIITF